jgi:uncharacterized protein YyaL (SSP411 family)
MLEDHVGLVSALALTWQADILDDAARYLDTALRDPETGLYAGSQDADEEYYSRDAEGRAQLTPPYVDRRVYVAWNAGLAVAYLEADLRLERPLLRERAVRLLDALFTRYRGPGGGLLHTDGVGGQLSDQVWGLLAAVRMGWTDRARELARHLEEGYGDPELGGYFDRAAGDELGRLTERVKPLQENSIAAIALHELGETESARRALESVASLPRQYGIMAAVFARALDRVRREPVRVTSRRRDSTRAAALTYPYAVVEEDGDERAVICIGTTCLQPLATPEDVVDALNARI